MEDERRRDLTFGPADILTDIEMSEGYHWCPEWDDLMVGPGHPEWGPNPQECLCGHILPHTRRID